MALIEVEIQNETHQSHHRIRFAAVPRIGEGIRLREPNGCWASYDVLDLWYQKADYGDVWVPYLHVCMTPADSAALAAAPKAPAPPPTQPHEVETYRSEPEPYHSEPEPYRSERPVYGEEEFVPYTA